MFGRKPRILIVDDDESLLKTLRRLFKDEGYDVEIAARGRRGLDIIVRWTPSLIILDIGMPEMSGLGFLKEISDTAGKPKYPVLILTARTNMEEFFSDVQVEGFIHKPCSCEQLLGEVKRVLREKRGGGKLSKPAPADTREVRGRVLLAEDNLAVADDLSDGLRRAGFEVEQVSDGAVVVEKALQALPNIVLAKRILAGMHGDQVARVLSELPKTQSIGVVLYEEGGIEETGRRLLRQSNVKRFLVTHATDDVVKAVKFVRAEMG